ncbi:hypothetical protein BpHYR1_020441 [Brachionus plicatilis]|uniref:G-protein coupled receptors family 1 profile domain-containing protein n=1 Tax=Brachionus plicatilis TaxID=10195 RepID=A0A3M7P865_BRAPC|nr:hypothetical protein BpHYR1_020441 [Brachionus plicatilis]
MTSRLITYQIEKMFMLVLVPIGILTNILSVFIFTKKKFNKTNMGFYGIGIGCANILQLIYYMFVQNSEILFNYNMSLASNDMCRTIVYFRRLIRQIAPIIETVMTLDRFMNVYFPRKFKFIIKKNYILTIILTIVGLFGMFDLLNLSYNLQPRSFYSKDYILTNITICTSSKKVRQYTDIGATILRTYVPLFTMFSLNLLIIKQLTRSRIKAHGTNMKREFDFTKSVLGMNGIFLKITTL